MTILDDHETVPLSFDTYGDGPPMIVLHGLFGSARNWRTVCTRFAEAYGVYAVNLRNHGASGWSPVMDYAAMAADLRAWMEREDIDSAVMIGHSLGGKTAMTLALAEPERVAALVVVDIAPVPYREGMLDYVDAVADAVLEGVTRRAEVDEDLSGLIPDPVTRGFILQNLVREGDRFHWRVNLDALRTSASAMTDFRANGTYGGPTLFIAGGRSQYITAEHRPAILTLFPKAEIYTIPHAGHRVHADQPEAFATAVRSFLRRAGAE